MTKQELAHIAKVMYDLQEYCRYEWDESEEIPCQKCLAGLNGLCDLFVPSRGIPRIWGITKETIERLEMSEKDIRRTWKLLCKFCDSFELDETEKAAFDIVIRVVGRKERENNGS